MESGQNDHIPKSSRTDSVLSDKYRVSPKTIRRDAKASEAIDTIGGKSPEAKRLILAGDVKIDKKMLESLADAGEEEIAGIAKSIEEGTLTPRQF